MPLLMRRRIFTPPNYSPVLSITRTIARGHTGKDVRNIQEWLCLHGHHVELDGRFGPATEQVVKDFQSAANTLPVTGVVDAETFALLVRPITEALRLITIAGGSPSLSDMVATYAYQHLLQRPREVGGQNRGPWVRLYLHGHERASRIAPQRAWAWCAGFASTVIEQAAVTLSVAPPLTYRWNCTNLGREAARRRLLVRGEHARRHPSRLRAGNLMLFRKRRPGHWHHVGVVVQVEKEFVRTIEGNSSHDPDVVPYGHEVSLNTRHYHDADFVVLE